MNEFIHLYRFVYDIQRNNNHNRACVCPLNNIKCIATTHWSHFKWFIICFDFPVWLPSIFMCGSNLMWMHFMWRSKKKELFRCDYDDDDDEEKETNDTSRLQLWCHFHLADKMERRNKIWVECLHEIVFSFKFGLFRWMCWVCICVCVCVRAYGDALVSHLIGVGKQLMCSINAEMYRTQPVFKDASQVWACVINALTSFAPERCRTFCTHFSLSICLYRHLPGSVSILCTLNCSIFFLKCVRSMKWKETHL